MTFDINKLNTDYEEYLEKTNRMLTDIKQSGFKIENEFNNKTYGYQYMIQRFLHGKGTAAPVVFYNKKFVLKQQFMVEYGISDATNDIFLRPILPDVFVCKFEKMSPELVQTETNRFNVGIKSMQIFMTITKEMSLDQQTALYRLNEAIQYVMTNEYCSKHISKKDLCNFLFNYADKLNG